tara:strand:- start:2644 stop:2988 length:345 start_codon:yes stop_codon:yes gene_type:complete
MDRFQNQIKQWVELDNKVKVLNNELRELRTERTNISDAIVSFVDTNNLDKAVIEISDGSLKFGTYKQTSAITLKFVKKCLSECIDNEETVEQLIQYIKSKRDIKMKSDIKRSYN